MPWLSKSVFVSTALAAILPLAGLAQAPAPTNFGQVAVGTAGTSTLTFTGVPASTAFAVNNSSDFSVGVPTCSGGNCAVVVTFQPLRPGLRRAGVVATNNGSAIANASVYGIGLAPQLNLAPGVISTIVSRSTPGVPAITPNGVAVGPPGTVYFSDTTNNIVYSLNTGTGQATAYAGNGPSGRAGDGGPATSAQLSSPSGLATDDQGNLFIADTGNHEIREVNGVTRVITTVAGNGTAGFSGDGGAATAAQLNYPNAVAVDVSGNIFISDTSNNRIRGVTVSSGVISTVAGTGTAAFSGDGGPATSATLNRPTGLTFDASGNLFIADNFNAVIREISGTTITTAVGNHTQGYSGDGGPATSAELYDPVGVVIDAGGDMYIGEQGNAVVRKVTGDASHTISTFAGNSQRISYTGDGGPASAATLSAPTYVALDEVGNLIIDDAGNRALRRISASNSLLNFPLTAVGQSASTVLTVSNTGNEPLNVSSMTFPANFAVGSGGTCSSTTPTLASGQSCTLTINFVAPASGNTGGTLQVTSNSLNQAGASAGATLTELNGLRFVSITPCRIADTRNAAGTYGGPALVGQASRDFPIANACNVPNTAQAYSLNATVVPGGNPLGYVTVWPSGQPQPNVSTVNSLDGRVKANAAIVPAGAGGVISVFASNNTNFVLDIDGYFIASNNPSYNTGLTFYPLPPCRVADTRGATGTFGGPFLAGQSTRTFPVAPNTTCNVPANAQAFSLNMTAVPKTPLGYLTVWPSDQTQPNVSTLNSLTGAVVANAAIVPASSTPGSQGNVNVFASNDTDLIIDINGYFAPANTGGLALYDVTPCRIIDTRSSGVFVNGLDVNVMGSSCSIPSTAQSYVLNATVIPPAPLGYLTLWAQGTTQPTGSTLNSLDGTVVSNLALIPTSNGSISAFASNPTNLVLDIFGYFAQ